MDSDSEHSSVGDVEDVDEDVVEQTLPFVQESVNLDDFAICSRYNGTVINCREYKKYPYREDLINEKISFDGNPIVVMPISVDDRKTSEEIQVAIVYKKAKMMLHIFGTKLRFFVIASEDKYKEINLILNVESEGKWSKATYHIAFHKNGYRRLINYGPDVQCFEITCDDVFFRHKSIKKLRDTDYEIAGDDLHIIRKLSGEYNICFSKPMKLNRYTTKFDSKNNYYIISVDYKDTEMDESANCDYLIMTNDIETIVDNTKSSATFPAVNEVHAHMFLFSATFHFGNSKQPVLKVSITDIDIVSPDCLIIRCDTYEDIVKSIAILMNYMKPDYVLGFNCSDYDWPFIVQRARFYNILESFAQQLSFKNKFDPRNFETKNRIKLSADTSLDRFKMNVFGMVFVDMRVYLMKLYPATKGEQSSSSLKTYLKKLRLDGKEDMDIMVMFEMYRNHKMGRPCPNLNNIIKYCVIDAQRCNDLNLASNCIVDILTTAKISYATADEWNTMANGAKVKNILAAKASELKLLMIHAHKNEINTGSTYEGAYVFPPVKGTTPDPLEMKVIREKLSKKEDCSDLLDRVGRPVTGLDFASLYPNIIINYNISPETFDAHKLSGEVYNIKISETLEGRFVKDSVILGIYPQILSKYFRIRKELKSKLASINAKIEAKDGDLEQLYKEKVIADVNQNAVKVIMNTFYGEAGNQVSPFYLKELASSVTAMGRFHIQRAAKLVESMGCKIWYGDTDSIYISSSRGTFAEIDKMLNLHQIGILEWFTKNVELSKIENERIRQLINNDIYELTGKRVLAMEREEELYPCLFAGKKKYCGIKHVDKVDFAINDYNLFARGLDFIKGSSTALIRDTMASIVKKAMDINNDTHIYDIVIKTLKNTNVTDRSSVKKKCLLKPDKNNAQLLNLKSKIENRQRRLAECKIPHTVYRIEFNVNFETVVVKPNINIYASSDNSVSSRTELFEYAEEHNLELDSIYYLNNTVKSCARLCHTIIPGYIDMDDDKVNKETIEVITTDLNTSTGILKYAVKRSIVSYIKETSKRFLPTEHCISWLIEIANTPEDKSYNTVVKEICARDKKVIENPNCGTDFKQHMRNMISARNLYEIIGQFIKNSAKLCYVSTQSERELILPTIFTKDIIELCIFINTAIDISTTCRIRSRQSTVA
jgi:DNA polymerase elongation subunit (family B)